MHFPHSPQLGKGELKLALGLFGVRLLQVRLSQVLVGVRNIRLLDHLVEHTDPLVHLA